MENTDFHTTTHTPESANANADNLPLKRGRGRPAKYAKEEREQKYKESRNNWNKTHLEQRYQMNDEYSSRTRFAYKILCEMWENKYFDDKNDKYKNILQNLIECKKITA